MREGTDELGLRKGTALSFMLKGNDLESLDIWYPKQRVGPSNGTKGKASSRKYDRSFFNSLSSPKSSDFLRFVSANQLFPVNLVTA